MKKIIFLICALVSLPLVYSCKEHEIPYYEGADAIFFDQQYGPSHFDSLKLSHQIYSYIPFGVIERTDSVLKVKVEVAGHIRDYDRPFGIEVVADSTNAVAGVDYELPSTEGVILAGQNSTRLTVIIHRTPHMEETTVQLQLRLIPGEHFVLPFGEEGLGVMPKRANGGDVQTALGMNFDPAIHNIFANCRLRRPAGWNDDNFGKYTEKKYELILKIAEEVFGWTVVDFDVDDDAKMKTSRSPRVAAHVAKYLLEQYRKGREYWVLDEDGSMMFVNGVSWAQGTMPDAMVQN